MKTLGKLFVFVGILVLVAAPARADWDTTMPSKYYQLPDLTNTGMDVNATWQQQADGTGLWPYVKVLADDFPCTTTGPITDIHIWGSWLNDQFNPNPTFKLSIHDDVPGGTTFSHPGNELWSRQFSPGSYLPKLLSSSATELFYEPNQNQIIGSDTRVWQYNFSIPAATAFVQQGTAANPKVYWLDVQAFVPGSEVFGWKTSLQHFNDDATFADTGAFGGPPTTAWTDLHYPSGTVYGGQSIDLSFAITTVPEPGTMVLLVAGMVGLLAYAWRRRK